MEQGESGPSSSKTEDQECTSASQMLAEPSRDHRFQQGLSSSGFNLWTPDTSREPQPRRNSALIRMGGREELTHTQSGLWLSSELSRRAETSEKH